MNVILSQSCESALIEAGYLCMYIDYSPKNRRRLLSAILRESSKALELSKWTSFFPCCSGPLSLWYIILKTQTELMPIVGRNYEIVRSLHPFLVLLGRDSKYDSRRSSIRQHFRWFPYGISHFCNESAFNSHLVFRFAARKFFYISRVSFSAVSTNFEC